MMVKAKDNFQQYTVECFCLALCYFSIGILGTKLALPPGYATAVFPASGIALFAILWRGYSIWPGIFLGSFFMNFWISFQNNPDISFALFIPVGIAIGLGASAGALLGAYAFQRLTGTKNPLEKVFTVIVFAVFSAAFNSMVSASVGVASLCLANIAPWNKFLESWFTWWLGDSIGVLIFAPMLMVLIKPTSFSLKPGQIIEVILLLFFIFTVCEGVFGAWVTDIPHPLIFLTFPILIWFAFRFNESGAMVGIGLVFLIATWETVSGNGPFVINRNSNESLLLLQIFLGSITLFTLFFTANLNEKKQIETSFNHLVSEIESIKNGEPLTIFSKEAFLNSAESPNLNESSKGKLFVLPFLFGLAIVIFTVFFWKGMTLEEETNLKHGVGLRMNIIKNEILSNIELQILDLKRMTSRWGRQGEPRLEEWVSDMNLHLEDYPVYQAIGWVDPTFYVRRIVPLEGNEKAINLDLSFEEKRHETLLRVKESRVLGITPLINLVQGGKGFNIYVPIYLGDDFAGLVGGVFRIKKLFDFILTREILAGISIAIYEDDEEIYRKNYTPFSEGDSFIKKTDLNFYNVNWRLAVWPDREFYNEHRSYNSKAVLFLGIFMAMIISFATYFAQKEKLRTWQIKFAHDKLENEIEKRTQAEKKIISAKEEAEKANRAKSLFLANMSHEIRTPMNAILGYSQILFRKKDLDKDTKDAIRTIDNSGKNLLKLINEVLDISKIEAGKMEMHSTDFDLSLLIKDLSDLFELRCKEKNLQWIVRGFSRSVIVHGDDTKLRQVLVNLLGNAIKFTDSGEVLFSVTTVEKNTYRFNIIDTGSGIPFEAQRKIFSAFHQGEEGDKKGGTGLGLAIAKKQLELMDSDLLLKSKVHEGSHFYFDLYLPPSMGETKKNIIKTDSILHLARGYQVTALVVDDVKENRDVLSKLLSVIGVEIIEATNGKEGVEKTKEFRPDIVFMDLRMPVMRGEDALKMIQDEFGKDQIKIIAITASVLDRKREDYLSMGFHDFISKPFKEEAVFDCLNNFLDVEFVYDDSEISESESSSLDELDLTQFSISEDLYKRMKKSAEMCNITEIEKISDELLKQDNTYEQLVDCILHLVKKYDMEGILIILDNLSKTKDSRSQE